MVLSEMSFPQTNPQTNLQYVSTMVERGDAVTPCLSCDLGTCACIVLPLIISMKI